MRGMRRGCIATSGNRRDRRTTTLWRGRRKAEASAAGLPRAGRTRRALPRAPASGALPHPHGRANGRPVRAGVVWCAAACVGLLAGGGDGRRAAAGSGRRQPRARRSYARCAPRALAAREFRTRGARAKTRALVRI
eukprot:scaffold689_cov375-Prasinococcus_capsulatus_cf.AAC.28